MFLRHTYVVAPATAACQHLDPRVFEGRDDLLRPLGSLKYLEVLSYGLIYLAYLVYLDYFGY